MNETPQNGVSRRVFLKVAGVAMAGIAAITRLFGVAWAGDRGSATAASRTDDSRPSIPAPEAKAERRWLRFTERARRIVFFAQEEAARQGTHFVGPEHLLLALLREEDCAGAEALKCMGVSLPRVREEVLRQIAPGSALRGSDMQLSPPGKRVIDYAYEEARQLCNNYVGSEHLLLAIFRLTEGLAPEALAKQGADLGRARRTALAVQQGRKGDRQQS